jgi:hypothetical protein
MPTRGQERQRVAMAKAKGNQPALVPRPVDDDQQVPARLATARQDTSGAGPSGSADLRVLRSSSRRLSAPGIEDVRRRSVGVRDAIENVSHICRCFAEV